MQMGRHLEKRLGESFYIWGFCPHLPCTIAVEIVPLLWYGPALRKARFGGERVHFSLLNMGLLR